LRSNIRTNIVSCLLLSLLLFIGCRVSYVLASFKLQWNNSSLRKTFLTHDLAMIARSVSLELWVTSQGQLRVCAMLFHPRARFSERFSRI